MVTLNDIRSIMGIDTHAGLNRHVEVEEFFMGPFCERDATTCIR